MPLRAPASYPEDLREFSRWCQETNPNPGTVSTEQIADAAITTDKIADANVTLAKLADMTADRILGRLSTAGVPTELTAAQVVGLLQTIAWVFASTVEFDGNAKFDANVGFYSTTPVAQQSDPGEPTMGVVSGTGDDVTLNGNFALLVVAINGLRTALNNYGLTA